MRGIKIVAYSILAVALALTLVLVITPTQVRSLTAVELIPIPDIGESLTGKGFTCTGMHYDEKDGVFYVSNYGLMHPRFTGSRPSIVKVSKDFKLVLGEIKLAHIYPQMKGLQGVTIDDSNRSFWVCSFEENKVRNFSSKGEAISSIDIERPTGIAYDSRSDTLWVLTYDALLQVGKTGDILRSIDIAFDDQDQIFLDEKNDVIYMTAGANYQGENYVYKVNLALGIAAKEYILTDSYAIEGIYIEGDRMYILNDGYFHDAKIPLNYVSVYELGYAG